MPRFASKRVAIRSSALALLVFLGASGAASAYQLPGTTIIATNSVSSSYASLQNWNLFQSIGAPFEQFGQSLQSINTRLNLGVPSEMPNISNGAPQAAHNAFEDFDAWLASITGGFHISEAFTIFLQIYSWILGTIKGAVDWLLLWVH